MSSTTTTALFDLLPAYFNKAKDDIVSFLTQPSLGVSSAVAEMVAQALSQADGTAVAGDGVALGDVLKSFLPAAVLPPSCVAATFTNLTFTANPQDQSLTFAGEIALPAAVFQFSAMFSLSSTVTSNIRSTAESLTGTVSVAGSAFSAQYDLSANKQTLTATYTPPADTTLDIGAIFGVFSVKTPDGVSDALAKLGFTAQQALLVVSLGDDASSALIQGSCELGDAFLLASSGGEEQGWTLTAGGCIAPPSGGQLTLKDLPLIGQDCLVDFSLAGGAELMVCTGKVNNFQVPLPEGSSSPLANFQPNLTPGATVAAVIDLTETADGTIAGNLVKMLGSDASTSQLFMVGQVPPGKLTIGLGVRPLLPKLPLNFDLTLAITPALLTVQLQGVCTLSGGSLDGLTFTAYLDISPETVTGGLGFDYPDGFKPNLPILPDLDLFELDGMLGVDLEKEEVLVGILTKFSMTSTAPDGSGPDGSKLNDVMPNVDGVSATSQLPEMAANEVALVMGVNVETAIPDIDLLILQFNDISLQGLLQCVPAVNSDAINSPIVSNLTATDIYLYWCDELPGALTLPDGTTPPTGFKFHGAFNFWDRLQVWASIAIIVSAEEGTSTGVSGQFYLSPVHVAGLLDIVSDGSEVPTEDMENALEQAGFKSGGPFLEFDSAGPTFLEGSWNMTIAGCATAAIDVTVTEQEFQFDLDMSVADFFKTDLTCTLDQDLKWSAAFDADLNGTLQLPVVVGIALGEANVGSGVSVDVDATCSFSGSILADPADLSLTVTGSFTFAGDSWSLPSNGLRIDLNKHVITDIKQLPQAILDAIGAEADNIFASALEGSTKLLVQFFNKEWSALVGVLETAYKDIAQTVAFICGRHRKKQPACPWLANNILVWTQGTTITSDPLNLDPNYSPAAIYLINGLQRYCIPDMTTYGRITTVLRPSSVVFKDGDPSGFSPDYVITIPVAPTEMPSAQDGTIYWTDNGGTPVTLNLTISIYDKNMNVVPSRYQIPGDGTSYQDNLSSLKVQNKPALLKLPCANDDINWLTDSFPFGDTCLCTADQSTYYLFRSGVTQLIPGTCAIFNLDFAYLPQSAISGIPQNPTALPTINNGDCVRATEAIYYVMNNALYHIKTAQDYTDWGLDAKTLVEVDPDILNLLVIKGDLKNNPNG
jgi:hypothetical protein